MLKLLGLMALVAVASAVDLNEPGVAVKQYPYHSTQDKPPGHENEPGCWISDLKKVLPFDQPYYPKDECEKYLCEEETWNAYQFSCDNKLRYGSKCHQEKEGDLKKQFPACCPVIKCDD